MRGILRHGACADGAQERSRPARTPCGLGGSQAAAAAAPSTALTARGMQVFERSACANCHTVRGRSAAGLLAPDLHALVAWLTTLKSQNPPTFPPLFCARCHGDDGKGVPMTFPSLAGNPSVLAKDTTSRIRLLVEGGNSASTLSGPPRQQMPGFAGLLSNARIADALTYVRGAWRNDAQPISGNDVASLRQILHK